MIPTMPSLTKFLGLILSSAVLASIVTLDELEKRSRPPLTGKFLGDGSQPGSVQLNDLTLVSDGGKFRKPVKIQLWCSSTGPISMIPWYAVSNDLSRNGDAKHYTWGSNPPHGTYQELVIDHDSEYVSAVGYDSCGPTGHQRICLLFIQKWNPTTKRAKSVKCGEDQQADRTGSVFDFTDANSDVGLRTFAWFTGTSTRNGIVGIQGHWVDLA